jgi:hypothetical protein
MVQLVLGTTAQLTLVPPSAGVSQAVSTVTAVDAKGNAVAFSRTGSVVTFDANVLVLGLRITVAVEWTVTYADATVQHQTTTTHAWVLDRSCGGYGDLDDILGYLGLLLPALTATSNPTISEVASLMARQSEEYDLRLSVAGYTVPLTSLVGLSQVGRAVSLAVAGQILRRFMTGRGDWAGVSTAKQYEDDAEDVVMRIVRGSVVLPEKQAAATFNFRRPGVAGTAPATSPSRINAFEDQYGATFDRGSW